MVAIAFIGSKKINKIAYAAYAIRAVFPDNFGFYGFCAGRILRGFLFLIFCWTVFPWIIGIVQDVYALTKPADTDGNIICSFY